MSYDVQDIKSSHYKDTNIFLISKQKVKNNFVRIAEHRVTRNMRCGVLRLTVECEVIARITRASQFEL